MEVPRGPTPEEYADFDQASQPRRRAITPQRVLGIAATVTAILLTATLAISAMQWFSENSSDHLLLGSWRSGDHTQFSKLRFTKGGFITMADKAGRISTAHYHFLAQYSIEVFLFDKSEPLHTWKLLLGRDEMTLTDAAGVTSHWRRE